MRVQVLLIPLVSSVGLLMGAGDPPPKGLQKFQGSWQRTSLVVEGKQIPEEGLKKAKLTVKGEKFSFVNGDMASGGTYQVDPSKKPQTLDIVITEGPDKGKTLPAIYEFSSGGLKICLSLKGKRPEAFASEPASGIILESWKKAKE